MNSVSSMVLWVFHIVIITVILQEIETQQYGIGSGIWPPWVLPTQLPFIQNKELLYTTSKVFPKQITVLNAPAQVGVVIDSVGGKVGILYGATGQGIVIDEPLRMGVMVDRGDWVIQQGFQSYLENCNISAIMEINAGNSFQLDEQHSQSQPVIFVQSSLIYFGDDFYARLAEAPGNLLTLTMDLFNYVMRPLKNVLGPVINISMEGWVVFKGGLLALQNKFLWMGKLVSFVDGGFVTLEAKAVRFPLTPIITTVDGTNAFFYMLKELTINFDLIKILNTVLSVPAQIAYFVAGLGGEVLLGITGVFKLVANVFDFVNSGTTFAVQGFINILVQFFGGKRPNLYEVQTTTNQLLTIADDQQQRFQNDFGPYRSFLSAVGGSGSFAVGGVPIESLVILLTDPTQMVTSQIVGVINLLRPVFPFGQFIPYLLAGMVNILNTTNGASYIENIIPSVKIPKDSLTNVTGDLLGASLRMFPSESSSEDLKLLPATAQLKRLPIVSSIYKALDEAVRKYDNSSLDDLLKNSTVADKLATVATRALQWPIR